MTRSRPYGIVRFTQADRGVLAEAHPLALAELRANADAAAARTPRDPAEMAFYAARLADADAATARIDALVRPGRRVALSEEELLAIRGRVDVLRRRVTAEAIAARTRGDAAGAKAAWDRAAAIDPLERRLAEPFARDTSQDAEDEEEEDEDDAPDGADEDGGAPGPGRP